MLMVQFNEAFYRNGCYQSKPLLLNPSEISSVEEDRSGYTDFVIIRMKNGTAYRLNDKHSEVVKKLDQLSKEET